MNIDLFPDIWFIIIFFHSVCCLFILCPLHAKIFKFHAVPSIFTFVACAFSVISKKSLPNSMSWSFYIWYARYNILDWLGLFSFSILNISSHSLLVCKVSTEKFNYYLTGDLAFLSLFFKILTCCDFWQLEYISQCWSLWFYFNGSFLIILNLYVNFLPQIWKFGAIISSNRLSNHLFLSSLSETPVMCNWPIKWHPTSPLGSLYSPCFSFCSSDSIISNDLSSSSQILFSVWFSLQLISYSQCLI